MSKLRTVDFLIQAISEACTREGFDVQVDPQELLKTETKSSSLLAAMSNVAVEVKLSDNKSKKKPLSDWAVSILRGLFVKSHSHYAIQIGVLDDLLQVGEWTPDYRAQLMDRWHSHQQLAAIARTWLLADYSDDLNLFLIGPPGSSTETEWINFAQTVERNDLVCRKLIWLPSKNESKWKGEIVTLLTRSFIAKPWIKTTSVSSVSLDAVSDISATLGEWSDALDESAYASDDYDALVITLLEKFKP